MERAEDTFCAASAPEAAFQDAHATAKYMIQWDLFWFPFSHTLQIIRLFTCQSKQENNSSRT